jgi:hypothetical protein
MDYRRYRTGPIRRQMKAELAAGPFESDRGRSLQVENNEVIRCERCLPNTTPGHHNPRAVKAGRKISGGPRVQATFM